MARNLLVALDGSDLADAALPHAISLASSLGASLILIRVHSPSLVALVQPHATVGTPGREIDAQLQSAACRWLDERAENLRRETSVAIRVEFRVGEPADEIVAVARESGALAIVCTTHGSGGWAPEWIGSVCDAVIRHAPCPVLALGRRASERRPGIARILVPLDGTERAERALPGATMLARACGARLEFFRVMAPEWLGEALTLRFPEGRDPLGVDALAADAKVTLDRLASGLRDGGLDVTAVVAVDNNPTRGVLQRIEESDPDLVVVTSGLRGVSRLVWRSLADRVLRAGGRPTLVIPETARE